MVVHTCLPSTWEEETRCWKIPSSNPDWFKQLLPGHQELHCETRSNKIKWPVSLFRLRNSEVLQGKRELYLFLSLGILGKYFYVYFTMSNGGFSITFVNFWDVCCLSCISQPGWKDRVHTLKNCILWSFFLFPPFLTLLIKVVDI